MKTQIVLFVTAIGFIFFPVLSHAATDQCRSQQYAVTTAQRQVTQAQQQVLSSENRLFSTQSQVEARTAQYSFQVEQARANAQAFRTVGASNSLACFSRNFFWGGRVGNCAFSVANAVQIRARANAVVNTQVARYNNYVAYSQQLIRRTALLVVQAQGRLNQAEMRLQAAEAAYQQCFSQA
jgi:hypothetical protein